MGELDKVESFLLDRRRTLVGSGLPVMIFGAKDVRGGFSVD
ncbi:uncharacterized protein G2W53_014230 [Senna tora]|uniref:Uncharacterized protein n=1 Tax=Senna tora TaxID=362788 RepID=A0A834WT55_9FABA|nr:uncharacterized protein G2W53_014230 [Senna tora]